MDEPKDDSWEDLTPVEPIRQSNAAQDISKLCSQEVANKMEMEKLPLVAQAVIKDWMLQAIRQTAEHYRKDFLKLEEKLRKANIDLILARSCAVRNG